MCMEVEVASDLHNGKVKLLLGAHSLLWQLLVGWCEHIR